MTLSKKYFSRDREISKVTGPKRVSVILTTDKISVDASSESADVKTTDTIVKEESINDQ